MSRNENEAERCIHHRHHAVRNHGDAGLSSASAMKYGTAPTDNTPYMATRTTNAVPPASANWEPMCTAKNLVHERINGHAETVTMNGSEPCGSCWSRSTHVGSSQHAVMSRRQDQGGERCRGAVDALCDACRHG